MSNNKSSHCLKHHSAHDMQLHKDQKKNCYVIKKKKVLCKLVWLSTTKCSWQKWHQMNRTNVSRQSPASVMWTWVWLNNTLSTVCLIGLPSCFVSYKMCWVHLGWRLPNLSRLGGHHSLTSQVSKGGVSQRRQTDLLWLLTYPQWDP